MFPLKVFFKIGSPGSDGSTGLKQSLTKKIPHSFFDAFNQLQVEEENKTCKSSLTLSPTFEDCVIREFFDPNAIAWNGALLGERN